MATRQQLSSGASTTRHPRPQQPQQQQLSRKRSSVAVTGDGGGDENGSAMERFHATFQAALTQELEALVRDLQAAAGSVDDPRRGGVGGRATRATVGELVARWSFVLATYRAHVAAEDEVVLPALAARVNNVAHAYELEHDMAEDELFDGGEGREAETEPNLTQRTHPVIN